MMHSVEKSEEAHFGGAKVILRAGRLFLAAIGADEKEIEASFCAAIRIAKEQKSVSLQKRAEETYADYRRQKSERLGRTWIPTTSLATVCSALASLKGLRLREPVFRSAIKRRPGRADSANRDGVSTHHIAFLR